MLVELEYFFEKQLKECRKVLTLLLLNVDHYILNKIYWREALFLVNGIWKYVLLNTPIGNTKQVLQDVWIIRISMYEYY